MIVSGGDGSVERDRRALAVDDRYERVHRRVVLLGGARVAVGEQTSRALGSPADVAVEQRLLFRRRIPDLLLKLLRHPASAASDVIGSFQSGVPTQHEKKKRD